MNKVMLLENTVCLSLTECWERVSVASIDRLFQVPSKDLEEATGERLLDELAEYQYDPGPIRESLN